MFIKEMPFQNPEELFSKRAQSQLCGGRVSSLLTSTCRSSAVSGFPFSPELRLYSSMVHDGWLRFPSDTLVSLRSVYSGLPLTWALTEGV